MFSGFMIMSAACFFRVNCTPSIDEIFFLCNILKNNFTNIFNNRIICVAIKISAYDPIIITSYTSAKIIKK